MTVINQIAKESTKEAEKEKAIQEEQRSSTSETTIGKEEIKGGKQKLQKKISQEESNIKSGDSTLHNARIHKHLLEVEDSLIHKITTVKKEINKLINVMSDFPEELKEKTLEEAKGRYINILNSKDKEPNQIFPKENEKMTRIRSPRRRPVEDPVKRKWADKDLWSKELLRVINFLPEYNQPCLQVCIIPKRKEDGQILIPNTPFDNKHKDTNESLNFGKEWIVGCHPLTENPKLIAVKILNQYNLLSTSNKEMLEQCYDSALRIHSISHMVSQSDNWIESIQMIMWLDINSRDEKITRELLSRLMEKKWKWSTPENARTLFQHSENVPESWKRMGNAHGNMFNLDLMDDA